MLHSSLRKLYIKFLRLTSCRSILCLGDSHIRVFNHPLFKLAFPNIYFDILAVDGATASGLMNPNSKTQAYKSFNDRLNILQNPHTIIFCLGEVDTGYVLWWRAQKHSLSVEIMLQEAIQKYVEFVSTIAALHKVIVISAPLPTIKDNSEIGEIANARKDVKVAQMDRTSMTLKFNTTVEKLLEQVENVFYINLDASSLDVNTGLIKQQLKNKKSENHHYDKSQYAKLIIPSLRNILKRNYLF